MKIGLHYFLYFFRTVLAVTGLILMVYYVITYLENLMYYFNNFPASSKIKLLYYFWQLPDLIIQIIPFSVLVAGVIVHWTAARFGEVTALRSAGVSLLRISTPFILGSLLFGVIHFGMAEFIRPYSHKKYSYIKNQVIEKKTDQNMFEKTNWIKSKQGILHFKEYQESTKTLDSPEYFLFNQEYTKLDFIVRSAIANFEPNKNVWILKNATVINLTKHTHHSIGSVSSYQTDIDFAPPKVLKDVISSTDISFFKLKKLINSAKEANIIVTDRLFDLYSKTSQPFSSLLFLLFTIPFAAQSDRKENSYFNILICLALTLSYWFGNIALKKLATHGILPPLVAAWSLNVIFAFLALIVIAKQNKPR